MPGPLVVPLIAAGSSLLGEGINAASQGTQNRKSRAFAMQMHQIQRDEALSDYAMQNEYNSPSSQMARLRKAGLNPNLVYGNGNAIQSAPSIKQAAAPTPETKAVTFNPGNAIAAFQNTKMMEAQIDNLKTQNQVMHQDMLKSAAETLGIMQSTKSSQFDLGVKTDIRDATVANAQLGVSKTSAEIANLQAQTKLTLTEEDVKAAMKQPNIEKALAEIVNIKKDTLLKGSQINLNSIEGKKKLTEIDELSERIHNMWLDGQLKQFDLDLKNMRGKASDYPGLWKVLNDAWDAVLNIQTIGGRATQKTEGERAPSKILKFK